MSQATDFNHEVEIRHREDVDLPACIAVLKRVFAKDRYPVQGTTQAESFLSSENIKPAFVAVFNDNVIGHVAVGKATDDDVAVALWRQLHVNNTSEPVAVLERLFVDPDNRGYGVAAKLINAAVTWSAQAGLRLVLFALAKDTTAAKLYERLGWRHFGTTAYHYGDGEEMDAWCYVSPATPS